MRTVKSSDQSLGLSFARSLPLRRINLAQTLEKLAEAQGRNLSYKELYASSDLGSVEAQAAKRWLMGFDLSTREDEITPFGHCVFTYDPTLATLPTQWICHYNFLCNHRNGPLFWRWAWFFILQSPDPVSREAISARIKHSSIESGEKSVSDETYETATRSFLNAYLSTDGLGNLGVLQEMVPPQYSFGASAQIPWRVFAYILADFWEANWGATLSVPYADLSTDAGPGALLLLNGGQIGPLLRPMQEAGLIEVSRVTRPWTVLRKWQSKDALLEAVYTHGDAT